VALTLGALVTSPGCTANDGSIAILRAESSIHQTPPQKPDALLELSYFSDGTALAVGLVTCQTDWRQSSVAVARLDWESARSPSFARFRPGVQSSKNNARSGGAIALDEGIAYMVMEGPDTDPEPSDCNEPLELALALLTRGHGVLENDQYARTFAGLLNGLTAGHSIDHSNLIAVLERMPAVFGGIPSREAGLLALARGTAGSPSALEVIDEPQYSAVELIEQVRGASVAELMPNDGPESLELARKYLILATRAISAIDPSEPAQAGLMRALRRLAFPFIIGRRTGSSATGTRCVIWSETPTADGVARVHYAYLDETNDRKIVVDVPMLIEDSDKGGQIELRCFKLDPRQVITISMELVSNPSFDPEGDRVAPQVYASKVQPSIQVIDDLSSDASLKRAIDAAIRLGSHRGLVPSRDEGRAAESSN